MNDRGTTMEQEATKQDTPSTDYKGRSICIYHPNGRGEGSAMRLEPRVNRHGEDRYNCFFLEMASQKSAAQRQNGKTDYATFDWENKITVKLGFLDVGELLTVLEGKVPHVGGQRKGLYHASGIGNTLISFNRDAQRGSYYLTLSRKRNGDAHPLRIGIGLSDVEATGLRCLLQTGLFFVTFPSLLKRNS